MMHRIIGLLVILGPCLPHGAQLSPKSLSRQCPKAEA